MFSTLIENVRGERRMRKILGVAFALAFVLLSIMTSVHGLIGTGVGAPDFTLNDVQGNSHTLSAQFGKVVLIEFFFTTSTPCQESVPELKAVRAAFGSELVMWSLDAWDTVAVLQNWETTYTLTWPDLVDNLNINGEYGIVGVPTFIIIDKVGVVQFTHLGWSAGINATLITEIQSLILAPPATIESCDSGGVAKDTFQLSDYVYAKGANYAPSKTYDVYVVADTTWVDGMAIPAAVPCTATTVTSDPNGNVPATLLWSPNLTPGGYDIVVDVNGNGKYDAGVDVLYDNNVQVTAGLFVIPEVYLGTILGLAAFFMAFGTYFMHKRRLLPRQF
jgi:peroxiredoxin